MKFSLATLKTFKTLIPGFVGLTLLTIKSVFLQTKAFESDIQLSPENSTLYTRLLRSAYDTMVKDIGSTILESSHDYFAFMLMVLFVNILLEGLKLLLIKNEKNHETFPWSNNSKEHQGSVKRITKSVLLYTFIYCFYQIIFWAAISPSPHNTLIQVPYDGLQTLRHLEQELPNDYETISSNNPYRTPSLSIGRVLSEVDIEGYRMILSKDQKTAFVVGSWATLFLTIIDVSDLEFPIILSSYQISQGTGYYGIIDQVMILSQDETKLYLSNADSLEIVDISNPRSPSTLSIAKDINAGKRTKISGFGQVTVGWPHVLISKDQQLLFAAGLGLQVFNISRSETPFSVSSVESPLYNNYLMPTSIALSPDGKTLYYADGGLSIYDISDPMNMRISRSFNTSFVISSMRLSRDGKIVYLAGFSKKHQLRLQKIYISENGSDLKEDQIIQLNREVSHLPLFLEQVPNDVFLFIKIDDDPTNKDSNVVIFDTREERMIEHEKFFIHSAYSILMSEDYQKMFFIASNRKMKIVNLYLDFPNKNSFSTSRNILQQFETNKKLTYINFGGDESYFYSIDSSSSKGGVSTLSMQRIESDELESLALYQIDNFKITKMTLLPDNTRAYLVIDSKVVYILDISSNSEKVIKMGEYRPNEISFIIRSLLITSKDGKTGYFSYQYENDLFKTRYNLIHIVDLSNPAEPVKMASLQLDQDFAHLKLSKDEKTLFIGGKNLTIYDVKTPDSPVLLANLALSAPGLTQGYNEMLLSYDEKFLFIKTERTSSPLVIQAIDITSLNSPKLLNEYRFPTSDRSSFAMTLSPDSKTIYLMRGDVLLAIDVSNPSSIRYSGAIMTIDEGSRDSVIDFKLSKDGKKTYIATVQGLVKVIGIQPAYSTYLLQDNLLLGERYTIDLMTLEMNKNLDYNQIAEAYKFTGFFFVEGYAAQNSTLALKMPPSWIIFDRKSHSLTVEARRKSDIKTYTTYFSFSKKVPDTVFDDYELEIPTKSQDLIAALISLGYLDNQLFLTENFGDPKDFYLSSTYSDLKDEIFAILKEYYFETYNELKIIPSLNLTYGEKFKIGTTNPASVRIDLILNSKGQFLSRNYGSLVPTITSNKSRIILEGSLADINLALKEVVVNLENNVTSCDGQITIDDNLNPIITESLKEISNYLNINNKPRLNKQSLIDNNSLQHQVDRHLVETGQYFQIKLDQDTFDDDFTAVESLRYSVALIKKDGSEAVLPDWLAFHDMTLSGTAPEALFDRDFELKIIVKNEFQEFKEPFTLHVNISSAFILKLLMKYLPYLLSILTLIISMNRIYNILGKRLYQHSKEFYLKPGEEVTSQVIFPIFLIAQEIEESKKIIKYLERDMIKESLVSNFATKSGIDKQKLIQKIKDYLSGLSKKEKSSFGLYFQGSASQKMTINQLVINDLVMKLLKSNEERETTMYYEKIKKDWTICVEWDSKNSFFKINDRKFENLLQSKGPQNLLNNDEAPLLNDRLHQVNLYLLKDAILAYAFECQSVNQYPQDVQIHVKERRESDFIWRFLKMDLKECVYSGAGKIGYGIESKKKFSMIYFCGVVEEDFLNKTIVFQIINSKHKILKELWIYSASADDDQLIEGDDHQEQSFYSLSELEARGKEYEAF